MAEIEILCVRINLHGLIYIREIVASVFGLMVANVGFKSRDWAPNPSVCHITDDGLREVVP